jgi:hypothetical protein
MWPPPNASERQEYRICCDPVAFRRRRNGETIANVGGNW